MKSINIDIDIDLDDLITSMNSYDKQAVADELSRYDIFPSRLKNINIVKSFIHSSGNVTELERELLELLDKVWENKIFLNTDDINTLRYLSKKGMY
jgi:hypothetical protein